MDDPSAPTDTSSPNEDNFDITPDQDGGVLKRIIKEGSDGGPCKGNQVTVHYVGTLLSGEKFDSSRDRDEKFEFSLGKGSVIKAWDLGVATMKRGEICVLTCTSKYAYGESGSPPKIPPDATLVFEIELFHWHGEDISEKKDGGILKTIIDEGDSKSYIHPNEGATVSVHITGVYEDKVFDDRDVDFVIGEGSNHRIIEGVEVALKKLKKNEKCRLRIQSKYAFDKEGQPEWGVPPNADVTYDVHLKQFEKLKEAWQMSEQEKLEQSEIVKNKGTGFFKDGNYKKAAHWYKKITDYLGSDTDFKGEDLEKRKVMLLAAHLNLAMCYLKTNENIEARDQCDKALEFDSDNEKGLFRRGQANLALGELKLARIDFQLVIKKDPNNKTAHKQLIVCQQKIKQHKDTEKKTYAGMFAKFAEQDAKKAPKTQQEEKKEEVEGKNGDEAKDEEKQS